MNQREEQQMSLSPVADRVEETILEMFGRDYEPDEYAVAEKMVDEDVAGGEYEGCSMELEMAYEEYRAEAARQL